MAEVKMATCRTNDAIVTFVSRRADRREPRCLCTPDKPPIHGDAFAIGHAPFPPAMTLSPMEKETLRASHRSPASAGQPNDGLKRSKTRVPSPFRDVQPAKAGTPCVG